MNERERLERRASRLRFLLRTNDYAREEELKPWLEELARIKRKLNRGHS